MERLERYLDQVCRGVGGPRALRQHLRRELREHLLDAVAEHRAAGLSAEEAVDRALADFGGPELVRSELEAAHGHRAMAVLIDKAMQWKERTMKATWLWASWAHLALAGVIGLEVLFLTLSNVFLLPRFQYIVQYVGYNPGTGGPGMTWVPSILSFLRWTADNTTWLLLASALVVGLFEWRLRSENKSLIRLSALGTAALGLMVVVTMSAAALLVPLLMLQPVLLAQIPERLTEEQTAALNAAVRSLEQAVEKKDWAVMREQAGEAAPLAKALGEQLRGAYLLARIKAVKDALTEVADAARDKDTARLKTAMRKLQEAHAPIREAARAEK